MYSRRFPYWAVSIFLACLTAAGSAGGVQQYDWLVVSTLEMTPTIVTRTGIGTANAMAEARISRQTLEAWCAGRGVDVAKCVREQMASDEVKKTYRATADCTRGRITTTDGQSYVFAGIWDQSDVGGGRTKWRDASGNVVGRDRASGGLGISQQWEVLCPGPVRTSGTSAAAPLPNPAPAAPRSRGGAAPAPVAVQEPPPLCPETTTPCTEVASFGATIADFRTSVSGRYRLVTATVRFTNKTNAPLILGYVHGSGTTIDDQGNRYVLNGANGLRGMGVIAGNSVDPKFLLQAGQSSDARFEHIWQPGREIIGTQFEMEMTIREIAPIPNNPSQYRLGLEHALRFSGLGNTSMTAAPATQAAPVAAATGAAPAGTLAEVNPCGNTPRCTSAGTFTAEVAQMTGSIAGGRHHVVTLNVRFRNVSDQPIILAYKSGSSVMIDNLGNRYAWGRPGTHDTSATGIGISTGRSANPQFVLNPGQSRSATFNVIRYEAARRQLGISFTYDVTIEQLEVLSSQQIRTLREYSLNFPDLALRTSAAESGRRLLDVLTGKKP